MPLMSCRSWVFLYRPLSRCNFDARDSWQEWVYTPPDPAPAFTRADPKDAYSFRFLQVQADKEGACRQLQQLEAEPTTTNVAKRFF